MEKELLELFDAAKKAADAAAIDGVSENGPEVSRCVDALNQLKSFPVTKNALVNTKVGRQLRHITKHPTEKIQTMATTLLEVWKQVVIDETTKSKKNGSLDIKSSVKIEVVKAETVKVEKLQQAGTMKAEKVTKAENGRIEKIIKGNSTKPATISGSGIVKVENKVAVRDTVKDEKINQIENMKVDIISREEKQASSIKKPSQPAVGPPKLTSLIKCNDATRDKIRELLLEALSKVASEADENIKDEVNAIDPIRVAVSVESKMFEKIGRSNGTQKLKYRSIMFNIKDPNNPDFRRKVLLGQIEPERLTTMAPDEMASDQRQKENKKITEKALFDCERGAAPKATTDQFRCGRCGQRKTTYHQMQTRSADEPMTTYVTCVNCNNHWKFC